MSDILVAAAGRAWERDVLHLVAGLDASAAGRRCVDVADLLALASMGTSRAAVLSLKLTGLDADTVHRLGALGVQVVAIIESDDAADRASMLGIEHLVSSDRLDDLERILGTWSPPLPVEQESSGDGTLTVVWGPSGAPGRSTLALNLGAELAHMGRPTILVDADPYGGTLAQMLAILDEVSGLLAATRAANSGNGASLAEQLVTVGPKLALLSGLPRSDLWPQLRPGAVARVIDEATRQCDHVIADVGFCLEGPDRFDSSAPHRNQTTLQLLAAADRIVAVGAADPLGLSRFARGLLELRDVAPAAELTVVINKRRPSLGWSTKEITETIQRLTGVSPDAVLPQDVAAVDRALMKGQSLRESAPDSALRKAITELSAVIR
ncbi:P-loop NTPase [soil metagenome]